MAEERSLNSQREFLAEWILLNLVGLVIGIYLVSMMTSSLESIQHLATEFGLVNDFQQTWTGQSMLVWFPLGICVGAAQWVKLRQLRINLLSWTLVTSLGCGIAGEIYTWMHTLYSFKFSIPSWVILLGWALVILNGGVIVSCLQSLIIRKQILRVELWMLAYIFGLLIPTTTAGLMLWAKSVFLNILFSSIFLMVFVPVRWFLFDAFLIVLTALSISILTGRVLLKQSNIGFARESAG